MFFTRLKKLHTKISKRVKEPELGRDIEAIKLDKAKLQILKQLYDYIEFGDWTTRSDMREKLAYTIRFGNKKAAEKYETTINSIKSTRYKASMTIKEKFNKDILTFIDMCDNIKTLGSLNESFANRIGVKADSVYELFPKCINENLPQTGEAMVRLETIMADCESLKSFSNKTLLKELNDMNKNVLFIINDIIRTESNARIYRLKHGLYEYFNDLIDIEQLEQIFIENGFNQ